jgi:hypothetical protein
MCWRTRRPTNYADYRSRPRRPYPLAYTYVEALLRSADLGWCGYGSECPGSQRLGDCSPTPAVVSGSHGGRIVSAEDEPGAEFVGGVDFEAVFAR